MRRVICVAGARPNFIKIKPVLDALERRAVETVLVHTGQHYDAGMSGVFFEELGIRPPDHSLEVGSGTHAVQTARVMTAFEPLLKRICPDLVVVVGDVNSTVACALVAAKSGAYVAHVEAGLRSRDWSMPEEVNRVVTDRVSDYLLASSPDAVDNLRAEGYREDQIHLVGNVMIDTLMANLGRARRRPVLKEMGVDAGAYGLVTLHRPANVDDATVLGGLITVLGELAAEFPLIFPVHPRTRARLEATGQLADVVAAPGVELVEPLPYREMLDAIAGARVVVTDSGGLQEEAAWLGVPTVVLRTSTPRWESVEAGIADLVGLDPDRALAAAAAFSDPLTQAWIAAVPCPYGDGFVSRRVAALLHDPEIHSLLTLDEPALPDAALAPTRLGVGAR
jgi:UDP-N-acetylglucosamine 2-epimerase (non-hydrolysing)